MATRRQVLQRALGTALLGGCRFTGARPPPLGPPPLETPWPAADRLLAELAAPRILERSFQYSPGADLQSALDACAKSGGGRVMVPPGVHEPGALRLASGVGLHLSAGAVLRFSADRSRFPEVLTRFEGLECVNRSPLIFAQDASDISITGEGVLDASRTEAWNRGADRAGVLEPLLERGAPPADRRATDRLCVSFVQFIRCRRVRIAGVTLRGAQFWQLHPILCSDVLIEGVTTEAGGANTDACDVESCERVVVRGCTLASGDDNVAIKSGRDADGRRVGVPCRRVLVAGCQAEGRFGFLALGSEISGGAENVFAFQNRAYGRGVGHALWIKSNARRGGYARAIRMSDFQATALGGAAVRIESDYAGQGGVELPRFADIEVSGLRAGRAERLLDAEGLAGAPVERLALRDFRIDDCTFEPLRARHVDVALEEVRVAGRLVAL